MITEWENHQHSKSTRTIRTVSNGRWQVESFSQGQVTGLWHIMQIAISKQRNKTGDQKLKSIVTHHATVAQIKRSLIEQKLDENQLLVDELKGKT